VRAWLCHPFGAAVEQIQTVTDIVRQVALADEIVIELGIADRRLGRGAILAVTTG